MKPCRKCGSTERNKSGRCKPCQRVRAAVWVKANPEKNRANTNAWRKANPEKERTRTAVWRKANASKSCAYSAKRTAIKIKAIPKWFEKELIEALYEECHRITIETGIEHNVDHIVPLQSELVQGFHCLANLRIISKTENSSKGNRHWPNMP